MTVYPLACNNFANEAARIPFPNDEVTPPVTKMYLVDDDIAENISRFFPWPEEFGGRTKLVINLAAKKCFEGKSLFFIQY